MGPDVLSASIRTVLPVRSRKVMAGQSVSSVRLETSVLSAQLMRRTTTNIDPTWPRTNV